MSAMTAPDDACAMKSIAGLTLSATPSIASPWIATAIWNTPRVPNREPIFAPSRMNAAIAKVPAVIAVPTEVAGVSRSVVMPAIETVERVHRERRLDLRQHHDDEREPRRDVAAPTLPFGGRRARARRRRTRVAPRHACTPVGRGCAAASVGLTVGPSDGAKPTAPSRTPH